MTDHWLNLAQTRIFPRPAGTTRDAHRRYLDAEIHSLESILYDAKELRNMQNTLVSMPEEVLLEIMTLVRDAPRTIRRSPRPSQPRWTHQDTCSQCGTYHLWTSITSVCRRLSAVARCPLLYSRADDATLPPTLILRTLARSASVPLDLYLSSEDFASSRKAKPLLESVIRQCKRIRSLTATDAIGTGPLVLAPPFRDLSIFTNMTHLALLQGSHGEPDPAFLGLGRSSEPLLDWQPPPHLESLHLDLAPFPWDNPIYNNLTELTLSNLYCGYYNAPTLTGICDLLQRMTRLERLTLYNVDIDLGPLIPQLIERPGQDIFDAEEEQERSAIEAAEAYLQKQRANGSFSLPASLNKIHATFLRNSALPLFMVPSVNNTYVLNDVSPVVPNETHGTFRRFLSTHFPRPTAKGHGSGVAGPVSAIKFTVNGKPTARQVCISYSRQLGLNTTPDAVLHFTVDQADVPYDCLVGLFDIHTRSANDRSTGAPLFDKVRELSLDCPTFYRNKYEDWAEALYHFPSLETLQFPEDMLHTIVMALRWRVTPGLDASPDVHEDRGALVDGEDKLQAGLNVQTIHVQPSQKYGFATARNTLELFESYLAYRKEKGRPLKEVRLPSGLMIGMVTKFSTEKLKTLVGQMT